MAKTLSHPTDVASLAAVVRSVVDELATRGRPVRTPVREGLELLERWLTGEPVDAEALQRAQGVAHENEVPLAQRESDRAVSWANTAVGNLLWMAQKMRGWKGADLGIMHAAEYALSSLGVPGVRDRAALDALRAEAAAHHVQRAKAPRAQKPRRAGTTLVPFIGRVASARLRALHAVFDPKARASEAELRALLETRRYPVHAAVLAFDARYGGLVVADAPGEEGHDWCFGAHACLAGGGHDAPRGGRDDLVPVVYSPNDVVYFLDASGAAWGQDTIEDTHAVPFAKDGDELVMRILGVAPPA